MRVGNSCGLEFSVARIIKFHSPLLALIFHPNMQTKTPTLNFHIKNCNGLHQIYLKKKLKKLGGNWEWVWSEPITQNNVVLACKHNCFNSTFCRCMHDDCPSTISICPLWRHQNSIFLDILSFYNFVVYGIYCRILLKLHDAAIHIILFPAKVSEARLVNVEHVHPCLLQIAITSKKL
jgi:hypothetical protein